MPGLSFTGRIARWSARHRWWVIGASALVIALAIFLLGAVETKERPDEEGAGESGKADELINERFRGPSPDLTHEGPRLHSHTEQLIFSNPSLDVDDATFRSTVDTTVSDLRALPQVTSAVSFYDTDEPEMVSADRRAVLGRIVIEAETHDDIDTEAVLSAVRDADAEAAGFEIGVFSTRLIEEQLEKNTDEDFQRIMVISLIVGLIILLLAFRAVVAAVIPLVLAVGAIFTAMGVSTLVSYAYSLNELYQEMILLMGLAVGIDYSLFVVSRFRRERAAGRPRLEAISVASNTTGRAVFYAGLTVVLSLAGLILVDHPIFISLALGAIIVVIVAVVGSLTLLPALLSVLGDNVNRLRLPFLGREEAGSGGIWGVITDKVLARPGILATVTAVALVALAVPVYSLNLGFNSGADALHDSIEGKRAIELLEEHFSSSLLRPAWVVVDDPDVNSPEIQLAVADLRSRVEQDEAFLGFAETRTNDAGDLLYLRVPLSGQIDDDRSEDGVRLLREEIIPAAFDGTKAKVYVGGDTAEGIDFTDHMYDVAPYVFGFVLGLSFLLLLVMFRSIVIPLKAIVLNLLSVAAAYGVLVMVFQWGWGISILGSESTGVIEVWLPLFLFAILFGLSMDYHMLLLSRVKEVYDQGFTNEESVSMGVKLTARADHQCGGHYGGGLRRLRLGAGYRTAAVRGWSRSCDPGRCHSHPLSAASGQHEAPGGCQLVPAQVAGLATEGCSREGGRILRRDAGAPV